MVRCPKPYRLHFVPRFTSVFNLNAFHCLCFDSERAFVFIPAVVRLLIETVPSARPPTLG